MSAMVYKASLPLQALAILTFGIYLAVALELSLQIAALLSLSLSIGISFSIALSLSLVLALIVQLQIALSLSLPELVINLKLALEFELTIVLGLIAQIDALIAACANASLISYAYVGSGTQLGPTLQAQIAGGWPDGTPLASSCTAYLFVATATGPYTPDQVESASLIPAPATPPTPPPPSPPAGSYPPPQAYEWGLASVTFPSSVSPTVVYPTDPATGTLTIDNSVATGVGAVTGVTITHHGSGYPGPALAMVSDTVSIVSVTTATPIVLRLPQPLSVPVGQGIGVTIAGVTSTTTASDATNASPIVVTVADTTGLVTCAISGALGNDAANGQWYCQVLDATHAALYADALYSVPSTGSGAYTGGATMAANVNGLQNAKVLTPTTVALYSDSALTVPVAGIGSYSGGTVTGGGTGAAVVATMGGGAQHALKSFFSGLLWPSTSPALAGGVTTFSLMLGTTFDLLLKLLDNLHSRASLLAAASASASIAVIPPSIGASITLMGKLVATLKANLSVGLRVFAGVALKAQIAIVLALYLGIAFMLSIGNVALEVWEYQGTGAGLPTALAAGPGTSGWHDGTATGTPIAAVVFGLTNGASATAFATFFGGA